MPKTVHYTKATVAGAPKSCYLFLDEPIGNKRVIGNKLTRDLTPGDRYSVTITISEKGVRFIRALTKISGDIPANPTDDYPTVEASATRPETYSFPVPIVDPNFFIMEKDEKLLRTLMAAYSDSNALVFLVGNQGTGKTTLAAQIAAIFGRNFFFFNCAQVREPMDWICRLSLDNGTVVAKPSLLLTAFTTPGCVICLNEFNRIDTTAHNAVYDIITGQESVYFDEISRSVKLAKGVIIFATMNIDLTNNGTFVMDAAMWDRATAVLELGWLPPSIEEMVLAKKTHAPEPVIKTVVSIANVLREKKKEGKTSIAPSMRWLISCVNLVQGGLPMYDAIKATFTERYSNIGFPNSERATAISVIKGKLP